MGNVHGDVDLGTFRWEVLKIVKEERALDDHAPTGAGKGCCEGEVECGGSRIEGASEEDAM